MAEAKTAPQLAVTDRQVVGSGAYLLTPAEAGKQIGASDDHVYRLIAAGALRAVDIAQPGARRSKTRIRSDDLQDYIDAQTRGSPPRGHDGSGPKPPSTSRSRRPQNTH